MDSSYLHKKTGASRLKRPLAWVFLAGIAGLAALIVAVMGLKGGIILAGLPIAVGIVISMFLKPKNGLYGALIMGFFLSGIARYVPAPWGLAVDGFLFIGLLGIVFKKFRETDWTPVRNDIWLWALVWYGYVFLELGNPEMRSPLAWFYAMRGVGFYQLLSFTIAFMVLRHPNELNRFLRITIIISVLGSLWGLRQKYIGTDAAEDYWLWDEGHWDEHVLFGVLRVFSFYSDAGQFGASQAMFALLCGILAISPEESTKNRILYAIAGLMTFIGFGISGTRGALAVPAAGGLAFLIVSNNVRLLAAGLLVMGLTFYMLKYTHILHGVEQVRRMRTALADDNPSLTARLRNQVTFGNHLRSLPFGGGIGTAGFWGNRFSPNTLLAQTPTDSYYVKIWAETGILGICLHMAMLGYFLGKGAYICLTLRNNVLRYKIMALYSSYAGVLLASYGNQVFSQMPTGMIMNIAIPLIFLSPLYDRMLEEKEFSEPET